MGKTSLIKSIVQLCEDIVHADFMTPNTMSTSTLQTSMERSRSLKASCPPTTQINEVWASTKAYPGWWTDLEDNRALRRRRSSIEDPILERNVCFVDTPGYGRGLSIAEGIQIVISYIEDQLPRSFSGAVGNKGELVSMLSGNGGTQVDAVLYLIGKGIEQEYPSNGNSADCQLPQKSSPQISISSSACHKLPTSFPYWPRRTR